MIIDVKIRVGIEETKNHEYQPTERIPERVQSLKQKIWIDLRQGGDFPGSTLVVMISVSEMVS